MGNNRFGLKKNSALVADFALTFLHYFSNTETEKSIADRVFQAFLEKF